MHVALMFGVIGGLGWVMSTAEQRAEADRKWDYIGKRMFAVMACVVAYWIYRG